MNFPTSDNSRPTIRCPACHGSGTQHCTKSGMRELCPACDGRGTIPNPKRDDLAESRRLRGSFTLVVVFVVACCVIVGVGGCVAYKVQKKVDQHNKRAATNDVDEFSARALSDYKSATGDKSAFALTMMQVVTQEVGVVTVWRLDTSSNLSDWRTLIETSDPGEAESTVAREFATPTNEAMFFRLISR